MYSYKSKSRSSKGDRDFVKKQTKNGRVYIRLNTDNENLGNGDYTLIYGNGNRRLGLLHCLQHKVSIKGIPCIASCANSVFFHKREGENTNAISALFSEASNRQNSIFTYYYSSFEMKEPQLITTTVWYRPLNLSESVRYGYQIIVPVLGDIKNRIKLAKKIYSNSIEHKYRETVYEDLDSVNIRKCAVLKPTREEWDQLVSSNIVWKTITDGENPILVFAYQQIPIVNKGKIAKIVYVEKTSHFNGIPLAEMESMMGIIAEDGYIAVHGINTGLFAMDKISFLLRLTRSRKTFITFSKYLGKLKATDISLLYL